MAQFEIFLRQRLQFKTKVILGIIAATVAFLFLITWVGAVLVFFEIVAAAIYYGRQKCTNCGARGQIVCAGTQEVGHVKGFDIFNRQDTAATRTRDNQGRPITSHSVINRQERAPSVHITYRTFYECKNCHNRTYVDSAKVEEDFTRSGNEVTREVYNTKVVEREVLKVPCKYCHTLVDPIRNGTCPNCGGKIV